MSTLGWTTRQHRLFAEYSGWNRAGYCGKEVRRMREWEKPEIREIKLEPEEDVLANCFTVSSNNSPLFAGCPSFACPDV